MFFYVGNLAYISYIFSIIFTIINYTLAFNELNSYLCHSYIYISLIDKTMKKILNVGIDIGSTTIKVVVADNNLNVLFKEYKRHYADIDNALLTVFNLIKDKYGNVDCKICMTGSAGMGIAERSGINFVQEVVSACDIVSLKYPEIRVLVDIGGEDAKIIFFKDGQAPDIRMNGSCAGGTGSFIDQISTLLNIDIDEMNRRASGANMVYPIASRCGVFCKTDIQNLLSQNVSKSDISASVFHAVSIQVITTLARGADILPKVMLCGGPFFFIPELRKAFTKVIKFDDSDVILSEYSDVLPAWGAALNAQNKATAKPLEEIINSVIASNQKKHLYNTSRLPQLFDKPEDFDTWKASKTRFHLPKRDSQLPFPEECFIGIDSGSTTTKIIALDKDGQLFYHSYQKNNGNSLQTLINGLRELNAQAIECGVNLKVLSSCVTGYGEDLLRTALSIEHGMVETIAHFVASSHFNPDISFILDIGGQDMKAIFIENGFIKKLEINEACSSGCGSFIETFARSLNMTAPQFSEIALESKFPCDLGTRCTVFMNSKVKQALREGAAVGDISAGLGYGVIRNCLNKVLKLRDYSELGDNIMLQGGTFRNIAVIRAMELETGKQVMITDFPELMGAFGTALFAKKQYEINNSSPKELAEMIKEQKIEEKFLYCKGCENNCQVKSHTFNNGNKYYSGNKCEKVFYSRGNRSKKGRNLHQEKYELIFDRKKEIASPRKVIGIPRALGMYEDYPFWYTLFTELNYKVVLSDTSTMKLYEKGSSSIMADNICFPAKLTNGHILNLIEKQVDRIFLPFVVYEKKDEKATPNSFNCPIVTGYSEVVKSAINPEEKYGIPFDAPSITFHDEKLLYKSSFAYFSSIGKISKSEFKKAFSAATAEQKKFETTIKNYCTETLNKAKEENRLIILLSGRPYHADPLIQHKISNIIADFGVDVICEDVARNTEPNINETQSIMQWAYTNRIIKSAMFAARYDNNLQYIELTSFSCGPDAFIIDEVSDILSRYGKHPTILKIDDINNTASIRLRIRSLVDSLKYKLSVKTVKDVEIPHTPKFEKADKQRTILIPWFGDMYSPLIPAAFAIQGYKMENLPPSNKISADVGLKYSNNEVCYPATLVIGDLIKALQSGKYDLSNIAVGITQTGGQCRATNYTAMIKKGLLAAGFDNIPLISVGVAGTVLNDQPGFKMNLPKLIKHVIPALIFTDCLSNMYYTTVPREIAPGLADEIREKYFDLARKALLSEKTDLLYTYIREAALEFIEANSGKDIPKVGIVGEIFVKYNNFGNKYVVKWLIENGIEPMIPALTNFFTDAFVNADIREKSLIHRKSIPNMFAKILENHINKIIKKMEDQIRDLPYFRSIGNSRKEAKLAEGIINLNAQFGEGWRIAAEIAHFAKSGVNNVISLQPFACIANQIVSKGIEKKLKELYPRLNILSLDFDSGMSEVNIYNRLHFIVKNAKEEVEQLTEKYELA